MTQPDDTKEMSGALITFEPSPDHYTITVPTFAAKVKLLTEENARLLTTQAELVKALEFYTEETDHYGQPDTKVAVKALNRLREKEEVK